LRLGSNKIYSMPELKMRRLAVLLQVPVQGSDW